MTLGQMSQPTNNRRNIPETAHLLDAGLQLVFGTYHIHGEKVLAHFEMPSSAAYDTLDKM
jgi:hypothetical protein